MCRGDWRLRISCGKRQGISRGQSPLPSHSTLLFLTVSPLQRWCDQAGLHGAGRSVPDEHGFGSKWWAVPLRLRRGEQPGREVRRGGRSSTPNRYPGVRIGRLLRRAYRASMSRSVAKHAIQTVACKSRRASHRVARAAGTAGCPFGNHGRCRRRCRACG